MSECKHCAYRLLCTDATVNTAFDTNDVDKMAGLPFLTKWIFGFVARGAPFKSSQQGALKRFSVHLEPAKLSKKAVDRWKCRCGLNPSLKSIIWKVDENFTIPRSFDHMFSWINMKNNNVKINKSLWPKNWIQCQYSKCHHLVVIYVYSCLWLL